MRESSAELARRLSAFEATARKAGLRMTHQRLVIFRQVAASKDHPDAEAIFRAVRRRLPTLSLDTVYRTLWLLNDLGVVGTLGPRRDSVRFDANLAPHHHYVCLRCGLARDFTCRGLDSLRVPKALRQLGRIESTQVEVRGICIRCARATRPTPRRRK